MLESFPTLSENNILTIEDFSRFSMSYAEMLQKILPVTNCVAFAFSAEQAEVHFSENSAAAELLRLFKQLREDSARYVIHADYLMLAFTVKGGAKCVALISGADPLFLHKVSEDYLLGIQEKVAREFLLLKQARVDSQTGLLNVSNLYSLLDMYGATEGLHLILLELPPKRTSFQYLVRYSQKCATLLLNFVQADSGLHCLGQSVFALVLQEDHEGGGLEIESALVTYLKREGCHRVHVGSSFFKKMGSGEQQTAHHGRRLLDEAWTALRHAAKRGPFSFCDFALLAHPENHPLAPPDRNLVRRLDRLWVQSDMFCLVRFAGDNADCPASRVVLPYINRGESLAGGDDIFVYLDGVTPGEALDWAKNVIRQTDNPEKNIHISAGVSSYPYGDFKKSEMVSNCQKALLHAAFFGKSSAVVFDAVSLNISGDIYFGDGDLAKAVKEYKRGLLCDNLDVNLHNSLGVALAMMNKLTSALQSFQRGLAIDGHSFMALYNLGLGEQARNRKAEALQYLEKALQYYSPEDDGKELVGDLILQLGIISCELGKYAAALAYLIPWQKENDTTQNAGRVHYYLGEAYYGMKNNGKAMEALQRALRFDEFDDRAMNLLGRIYLEEGEGDQIALSLCRKSVELEPGNFRYMLYLAEVLLRCGSPQEAKENLYRCLRNQDCKMKAQLLLGRTYTLEKQYRRAESWFLKVMQQEDHRPDLYEKAVKGLQKIRSKIMR
ncbi:tetratricopeptide repeat protein [Desulfocastanea catecholica]